MPNDIDDDDDCLTLALAMLTIIVVRNFIATHSLLS
jgi:hypothetical protein